MKPDYSHSISMQCSTCGGEAFEFEGDEGPVRCVGCDRTYTREDLMRENGARIDTDIADMKAEIFSDMRKDVSKMFKKFK